MMIRKLWLLAILLFYATVNAQQVRLMGVVLDGENGRALSSASVINVKTNNSSMTDNTGSFITYCDRHDTLFLFLPGYQTVKFSAADSAKKDEYVFQLYMMPLSTGLNKPVIVRPKKDLEDLEKERKDIDKIPKELEQPDISPFTSPISFLYEMLSPRAKERAKLREQIVEDNRRRVFQEFYRYFNEQGLFDLSEEYFDDFTDFHQLPTEFLKYKSDYEITSTLLTQYKKYARLKRIDQRY